MIKEGSTKIVNFKIPTGIDQTKREYGYDDQGSIMCKIFTSFIFVVF